jgi:hypothetical protein
LGTLWKLGNLLSTGGAPVGMRPSYLRSAKRGRRERTRQKEQRWWQRTKCRPRLQECRIRARWWRRSMRTRNHRYYCQNFYLAQNGPETTKFGQEMRFCGGGEEASEKRERIIVVLVFVVVVISACATMSYGSRGIAS